MNTDILMTIWVIAVIVLFIITIHNASKERDRRTQEMIDDAIEEERQKGKQFTLELKDDQRVMLARQAESLGLSLNDYLVMSVSKLDKDKE